MYSKPELQRVLETAFLPSKCECVISANDSFSVKLTNAESGEIELYVTGMPLSDLSSSRSIAHLVLSLREQRDLMAKMELSMRRLG
ncbi:hypothetical protein PSCICM_26750 [Pseudomonas cichorii]|uniref:DUF1652 domain-containing protein n=1 Tax=Pseudomonas cichorii TaxID=36746 RepID=UPI001910E378|nr:DUF1652 domain-containing protein [Pseudomonas cichorii]GFM64086.1 hypothetical protein PSCICJ_02040 [Pseudomonas cichorii]GFM76856.1 hypothetical protein PSCICM_26750 [Pseudomonas cichorii]